MALPRKGLSGVEKIADTRAWTKSIAESAASKEVKDQAGKKVYKLKNMSTI